MSDIDITHMKIAETHSVLKKFEGDLTEEEMESTVPAEEIHIHNEEIVKHIVDGEVVYDKEQGIGEKPDFSAPTTEQE